MGMPNPNLPDNIRLRPKEASFLAVVVLSAIFMVIFFICSYFFVESDGTNLLPRVHPRDAEPTSELIVPEVGFSANVQVDRP
jgi:hypothetical protein